MCGFISSTSQTVVVKDEDESYYVKAVLTHSRGRAAAGYTHFTLSLIHTARFTKLYLHQE